MSYIDLYPSSNLMYGLIYKGWKKLTVNPSIPGCTVTFTVSEGEPRVLEGDNSIWVPYKADHIIQVSYTVSKEGYETENGTAMMNQDWSIPVLMTVKQVILKINVVPTGLSPQFSFYDEEGNVIDPYEISTNYEAVKVSYGTTVSWSVSASGYSDPATGVTENIKDDTEFTLDFTRLYATLTVNVTSPSGATVKLNGATYANNQITVVTGNSITYEVSKTGYVTETSVVTLLEDRTINVSLNVTRVKATVNVIPASTNPTITFTTSPSGTGNPVLSQDGKSITVDYGTTVNYSITAIGYTAQSGSSMVGSFPNMTSDEEEDVYLQLKPVTLTVNVLPSGISPTVSFRYMNNETIPSINNSVTVIYGTYVQYQASATGYDASEWTTIEVKDTGNTGTLSTSVTLVKSRVTLTIQAVNSSQQVISGAVVNFSNATGSNPTVSGNSITLDYGSNVNYSITADGYFPSSGVITSVTSTATQNVQLTQKVIFTINPTPSNAMVTLTAQGFDQQSNSITVTPGTTIHYKVEASGYKTEEGDQVVNSTIIKNVVLKQMVTITINPIPVEASVTLTASGYTQVGKSITVPQGTDVSYTVSLYGYDSTTNVITVNSAQTLNVEIYPHRYTLTVSPTPSTATVSFLSTAGNPEVSGNQVIVDYNTKVDFIIREDGYLPYESSYTVISDNIEEISMNTSKFVMVGKSGYISSASSNISTSGSWTTIEVGSDDWNSITYGKRKFLAVGDYGRVATLADGGTNWVVLTRDETGMPNKDLMYVTYAKGKFVAVGDAGAICYSEDGLTWTEAIITNSSGEVISHTSKLYGVVFGDNKFISVGAAGSYLISEDGVTWVLHTIGVNVDLYSATYGNGFYVVGALGYVFYTPSDLSDWNNAVSTSGSSRVYFNNVKYLNGRFVAVGYSRSSSTNYLKIYTSVNGDSNWSQVYSTVKSNSALYSAAYGVETYVAVGLNRTFLYSTASNASNWTQIYYFTGDWYDIIYPS